MRTDRNDSVVNRGVKLRRQVVQVLLPALLAPLLVQLIAPAPAHAQQYGEGAEFDQVGTSGEGAGSEGGAIAAAHADADRRANAAARPNRARRTRTDPKPATYQDPKTGLWHASVANSYRVERSAQKGGH